MMRICIICELWLVRPLLEEGVVSYWCQRCESTPPVIEDIGADGIMPDKPEVSTRGISQLQESER